MAKIEVEEEQLRILLLQNETMKADLKKVCSAFSGAVKVLGLEKSISEGNHNVLMKIPSIIMKVKKNPEAFNFMDPLLLEIIEKYTV